MPDPRLYLDQALSEGARLRLDEGQSAKLTRVLRLGLGGRVRVFNPRDGEWLGEIDAKDAKGVALKLRSQLRPARAAPDLDLLFAPLKRDATDLLIEKATELGVRRLRPVLTAHTIAQQVRADRLTLIARQAAEQSERFDAPEIAPLMPLARALDGWEAGRSLIWADEAGEVWGGAQATPIAEALTKGGGIGLLVGPEGGFAPEEQRLLRSLPFVVPVSLGPRILRAETAAIAGLAFIQALVGDWRS
jgi:16S rRNA (uracil1498-N3)-methyltransferase